jgi:3-oxoacyl-[acyl-carrier-protein] synthase II
VTGYGCLTTQGNGAASWWSGMRDASSAARSIKRFNTEKFRTKIGAEIDAEQLVSTGVNTGGLSRNAQFSVIAAYEALTHSGLLKHAELAAGTGICLGSGLGGIYFSEEAITALRDNGPRGINPMTVPFVDPNGIVNQIALNWGLCGLQFTVSTACSSSAHAIGLALDMIRAGRCDAVLAGGVEATMSPLVFAGFDRLRAMSARNGEPQTACRPFSADRDGFVMGEGAAMLVLERESVARARGATIHAVLCGYGASGGAHHPVMPRPDGSDQIVAMRAALRDAGISAQEIDLINPHGTGTKLNDDAELLAIRAVFGATLDSIAVTPTKQLTGHLLGAAGALESLYLVKCIAEQCVTPILQVDGSSSLNIQTGSVRSKALRFALNNSFGFGNNNVSLIFGVHS